MSVLRMSGSYSAMARQHDDAESGGQRHDQGQYVELGHYTRVLRQRWPLVVLGMLLGVLGGLGYLAVAPQHVQATAVVNLNVISSEPFNDTRPESQLIDAGVEDGEFGVDRAERADPCGAARPPVFCWPAGPGCRNSKMELWIRSL